MRKKHRESEESDIFRPPVVLNGEFQNLDKEVNDLLTEMEFNPFQKITEVFDIAITLGEVGTAYSCAKFLAGYVKPITKQVDQKVVVQILHQGVPSETQSPSGVHVTTFKAEHIDEYIEVESRPVRIIADTVIPLEISVGENKIPLEINVRDNNVTV